MVFHLLSLGEIMWSVEFLQGPTIFYEKKELQPDVVNVLRNYYLSKPMPANEFSGWLRNWERLANEEAAGLNTSDSLILRPRLIN